MDFEVANYMLSKENVDSELPIQNVCLYFNAAHICLMILRLAISNSDHRWMEHGDSKKSLLDFRNFFCRRNIGSNWLET